ncbi:MAG: extracellular solute-binding protein [Candidatus Syntrophosphaera sp.]|nr:extracellular solute-binding protein [Candidatus Syntrophosphaera sp.]
MRRLVSLLLLAVLLAACQKTEPVPKDPAPPSQLNIFALQEMQDSGFEAAVFREFASQNNTTLALSHFSDLPSLLSALAKDENQGRVDLVLGLNSAFAILDSLLEPFSPLPEISLLEISHDIPREPQQRLIPYAQAHLALLYNSKAFPNPPQSFGELQDARYYSQMAITDASKDGLGRASLLWSVALFGENGYDKLWSSLRKNVRRVYSDRWEALDALRRDECKLMLGFHCTPAWIEEFYPSEIHIKASIPQEGSFRYVESAAVPKDAPNRDVALEFLRNLISSETQQFVIFKLGLLPVNGRTPLPRQFSRIPLSVYATNDRLEQDLVKENLPAWLDRWNYLVNRIPGF